MAEFYEEEIDSSIETMTSLIEPIVIVLLGAVVTVILISMYLPMFEMVGNIQ